MNNNSNTETFKLTSKNSANYILSELNRLIKNDITIKKNENRNMSIWYLDQNYKIRGEVNFKNNSFRIIYVRNHIDYISYKYSRFVEGKIAETNEGSIIEYKLSPKPKFNPYKLLGILPLLMFVKILELYYQLQTQSFELLNLIFIHLIFTPFFTAFGFVIYYIFFWSNNEINENVHKVLAKITGHV